MQLRPKRQERKRIRQGQRQACEAAVRENYAAIYRFMVYLTGDWTLAEDLTQETFTAAWVNIDNYKAKASLSTWLHSIAYRKFIDSGRKLKRYGRLMNKLKQDKPDQMQTIDPLARLMADEQLGVLYENVQKLDPPQYVAILLHYIQGLSFRQMSEILDQSVGTVKWRTSNALKKLKALLADRIES